MRNIVLLNVALSDTRGELLLYLSEYSGRHTIKRSIKYVSVQRVQALTLDDIVRTYGCPDIIKIDVEDAEVDVLRGGIECFDKCQPVILIEFRKDTYYAVKHLLTKFSYICFKTQSDYMFCHKSLD
jgi:FkbM family methyltransferase